MIEILSSTPLATVQDLGRDGYRRFGLGTAGAMDPVALMAGNILLGNEEGAAGVEIPIMPFQVRFGADLGFAVTGADALADLDGAPVPPWWAMPARKGQVLTLRPPATGSRCYLTIESGIDVPVVLGSRSTQLRGVFGGHGGRMLEKGDVLHVAPTENGRVGLPEAGLGAEPPQLVAALGEVIGGATRVRVIPAAEYHAFAAEALEAFWTTRWKITPESNRAGYRLAGPALELARSIELRSHGIVSGVIQVPHGGQPIIQLADAATAGGYPKIGTVIEADLWRLGQARLGSDIRFAETTYAEAVAALAELRTYLDQLRRLAALCRGGSRS